MNCAQKAHKISKAPQSPQSFALADMPTNPAAGLLHLCLVAQAGPLNFYAMDSASRSSWLDDGLHMTEYGYDQLAGHIAGVINANGPTTRKH